MEQITNIDNVCYIARLDFRAFHRFVQYLEDRDKKKPYIIGLYGKT